MGAGEPADEVLVLRARSGDRGAFEDLVRRHQDRIYRLALRLSGNTEDGADIAQETFVHAFTAIASFRGESSFSTWLYRIAVNLARDHRRSSVRRARWMEPDGEVPRGERAAGPEDPESHALGEEMTRRLERAVEDLPEIYREAFVMRFVGRIPYEEMCTILNLPLPALKMRVHRARKLVEQALAGPSAPDGREEA